MLSGRNLAIVVGNAQEDLRWRKGYLKKKKKKKYKGRETRRIEGHGKSFRGERV